MSQCLMFELSPLYHANYKVHVKLHYQSNDTGCGTGNYICALSPYVGQITGVEFNPGMLEQAKAKTSHLQNVKLLQGDGTNIPLPDGCCDVVYSTQVKQV